MGTSNDRHRHPQRRCQDDRPLSRDSPRLWLGRPALAGGPFDHRIDRGRRVGCLSHRKAHARGEGAVLEP
jgi:hypothetical protein